MQFRYNLWKIEYGCQWTSYQNECLEEELYKNYLRTSSGSQAEAGKSENFSV